MIFIVKQPFVNFVSYFFSCLAPTVDKDEDFDDSSWIGMLVCLIQHCLFTNGARRLLKKNETVELDCLIQQSPSSSSN